ncbi:MAG: SMP-30/gluconolactonase/LRE family protein [Acidobacteria bacterium]|nr:SMP-30/gluconolactonase/LRE family protein [Acidobacteriota bacterium]
MIIEAQQELDAKATLGEGPCWDARRQSLYWVDIEEHRLHIYDPAKREDRAIDVGQPIGAAVMRKSGGVLLALRQGFYAFDLDTETLEHLDDPETDLPENRFNDGKCDPAGRFWAGTMAVSEAPNRGSLYCLDTDLTVHKRVEAVSISNGLAWSLDERMMYYVDSPTRVVSAFDYDKASGEISNRRAAIQIPDGMGFPDGMTIDEEGMLWIAMWDGAMVGRWNPANGSLLSEIPLPVSRPTSCVFGGKNLDELYITSARSRLDKETLAAQPLAGGVFKCKPGIRGGPAWDFAG